MFKAQYQPHEIQSYLFLAIELRRDRYSRTELAQITRAVNRVFDMPALLIFKHGSTLTFSIINRRLHKRDQSRDVLEKVTLIKDVVIAQPHRAHIEILHDLSFGQLQARRGCQTFTELHAAWAKTLDIQELNRTFYRELANWYFWAVKHVQFPQDGGADANKRHPVAVIRLLTRLIFVWFIKEKGLIPDDLFNRARLRELLKIDPAASPETSHYYQAVLQNLVFATLNVEMGMDEPGRPRRRWAGENRRAAAPAGII